MRKNTEVEVGVEDLRAIKTAPMTKQPSTQILHNMRQRCYQNWCSMDRYTHIYIEISPFYVTTEDVPSWQWVLFGLPNTQCNGLYNKGLL